MPAPTKTGSEDTPKATTRDAPAQQGASENPELDAAVAEAEAQGYWGVRDNEHDDEEFALTTGPDSPGAPVL